MLLTSWQQQAGNRTKASASDGQMIVTNMGCFEAFRTGSKVVKSEY